MSLTVALQDIQKELDALKLRVKHGAALNAHVARRMLPRFQRHFRSNAARERNSFGARSTFWNRMLSGLRAQANDQAAMIVMPREVAQRFFGGTIRAKKSRFLAIPARREAYGKSPRQFDDLQFIVTDNGPMLVQRAASLIKAVRRKGEVKIKQVGEQGGGVFFWLRRSVRQRPDRSLLPSDAEIKSDLVLILRDRTSKQGGKS